MSWKRAIFLGGAVFLLAACDRITAPPSSTLEQTHRSAAAVAKKSYVDPGTLETCRSGYSVQVGRADTTASVSLCRR
jgi:hypothetical protein